MKIVCCCDDCARVIKAAILAVWDRDPAHWAGEWWLRFQADLGKSDLRFYRECLADLVGRGILIKTWHENYGYPVFLPARHTLPARNRGGA